MKKRERRKLERSIDRTFLKVYRNQELQVFLHFSNMFLKQFVKEEDELLFFVMRLRAGLLL